MTYNFWSPVLISIQTAFSAGIIVMIFGVIIGRFMAEKRFKGKLLVETLLMLPLVLPPSVVGFLLVVVFGKNSFIGQMIEELFNQTIIFTWYAAVIAAVVVAFPLMYQAAKTGFQSIDKAAIEAARIDGGTERQIFLFIAIPLAIKSIASGAILSFTRAIGEFGATLMFAGNIPGKTQTVPTAIYIAIDTGEMGYAWGWVAVTLLLSFMLLAFTYWFSPSKSN